VKVERKRDAIIKRASSFPSRVGATHGKSRQLRGNQERRFGNNPKPGDSSHERKKSAPLLMFGNKIQRVYIEGGGSTGRIN